MRIDAHQHFWKYTPEEYGWIGDDMAEIRRDFLPDDLAEEICAVGIEGVVAVQARTTLEETSWLLNLKSHHSLIRGVVGWVPLHDAHIGDRLAELGLGLCGVREVCQGQASGFMLRPEFVAGAKRLAEFHLAYDILIFADQLEEAVRLVDLCPGQTFVLDHLAKPRIKAGEIEAWARRLGDLAKRENVFCKVSGMVTEADSANWSEAQLRPYFDVALEAFGPRKLMFGSDWPVCLTAASYTRWCKVVDGFIADLSEGEKAEILGGTAMRAYRLL